MFRSIKTNFRANPIFLFLVIYRWVSLIPAVFMLTSRADAWMPPAIVFIIALFVNSVISIFNRPLNKAVMEYPAFLSVDILFSTFILAVSGGVQSPYYLYALSPLLAGAFFFQMRGALVVSAVFTPLYLFSNYYGGFVDTMRDSVVLMTQLAGIWLIPILIAYPSTLLKSINHVNNNLETAHRQLEIIHDLTMLLQAAPDLVSVQTQVLNAVTTDLGFSKAVLALVDPTREELGGWMVFPPEESFPNVMPISLNPVHGDLVKSLLTRSHFTTNGQHLLPDAEFNAWLANDKWFVLPLYLREHPVGILLVEEAGLTKEKEATLMTVANQAALALGTTILCIDRARSLAIETERNRIARDIHDTVAQSLFGITYSLEACIAMLPEQVEDVRKELVELRTLARDAHDGVRRSIFDLWPSALTIELFMGDLTNYVSNCCRSRAFSIIFNHHGDFNSLPSGMRRTIYRMAQEALANAARHSGANSARLCLTISNDEVFLDISDQGRGFDPAIALSRSQNREHFGLHGIQERARVMGGDFEIISQPNEGTRIMINLPIHGHHHV
ncbi:MAG: sensor histidine kinase [Chloroflexi bacterium]|nr:sensor histidine kinase [Chloroflexota bacterium]